MIPVSGPWVPVRVPPPGSEAEKLGQLVVAVLILIPALVIGLLLASCALTVTVSMEGKAIFHVVLELGAVKPEADAA